MSSILHGHYLGGTQNAAEEKSRADEAEKKIRELQEKLAAYENK